MKNLLSKTFLAFLLLFPSAVWASDFATVSENHVEILKKKGESEIVGYLYVGMQVEVSKSDDGYAHVQFGSIKGWVEEDSLTLFDDHMEPAETSTVLSPFILYDENSDYLFYNSGSEMVKMDVFTREIIDSVPSEGASQIFAAEDTELFLIETPYTNESSNYNAYTLCNMQDSGKMITIFPSEIFVADAFFSGSGRYLCLTLNFDDMNYAAVFESESGDLIAFAEDVGLVCWWNESLIMSDGENLWIQDFQSDFIGYDLSYSSALALAEFPKNDDIDDLKLAENALYLKTEEEVLKLDLLTLEFFETDLQSLVTDETKTLNFSIDDDGEASLKNLESGKSYDDFEGLDPDFEFIQFISGYAAYRAKMAENIDTLFLFDAENEDELYHYRMIDDIQAFGRDAVAAEAVIDSGDTFIFIEIPAKSRFSITLLEGENHVE